MRRINSAYFARNTHFGANEYKKEVVIVLLTDEQYVVKWLSQYGALPRAQIIKMLQKPPQTAEKFSLSIRSAILFQRRTEARECSAA